jgi:hypothetical protein
MTTTDIEVQASRHLGQLLFIFGRLEMNIGLALLNSYPVSELNEVAERFEEAPFGVKLGELANRVDARRGDNGGDFKAWDDWVADARHLRTLRNRLAHGRWGFIEATGTIAHVCGLPGGAKQEEIRFTLPEFASKVAEAGRVSAQFSAMQKWLSTLFF